MSLNDGKLASLHLKMKQMILYLKGCKLSLVYESQTIFCPLHTKSIGAIFSPYSCFLHEDMLGFTCSNRDNGESLGNTFKDEIISTCTNWLKRESASL